MLGRLESKLSSLQSRGATRRLVLTLTVIFFGLLYVEVYVGHLPVLDRHVLNGSAVPIAALPLALAALGLAQIVPGRFSGIVLELVMALSVAVGIAGFFFHLNANGVTGAHLTPIFYIHTWSGRDSPAWPLSISLAGLVGLWAGWGLGRDQDFMTAGLAATRAFLGMYLLVGAAFYAGLIIVNLQAIKGIGLIVFGLAVLGYVALMGADLASMLLSRLTAEKEIAS